VEQIVSLVGETGMTPAQRNTEYEILRIFEQQQPDGGSDTECSVQKESYLQA